MSLVCASVVLCVRLLRSSDAAMVDSTTISTDVPGAPRSRLDNSAALRSVAPCVRVACTGERKIGCDENCLDKSGNSIPGDQIPFSTL